MTDSLFRLAQRHNQYVHKAYQSGGFNDRSDADRATARLIDEQSSHAAKGEQHGGGRAEDIDLPARIIPYAGNREWATEFRSNDRSRLARIVFDPGEPFVLEYNSLAGVSGCVEFQDGALALRRAYEWLIGNHEPRPPSEPKSPAPDAEGDKQFTCDGCRKPVAKRGVWKTYCDECHAKGMRDEGLGTLRLSPRSEDGQRGFQDGMLQVCRILGYGNADTSPHALVEFICSEAKKWDAAEESAEALGRAEAHIAELTNPKTTYGEEWVAALPPGHWIKVWVGDTDAIREELNWNAMSSPAIVAVRKLKERAERAEARLAAALAELRAVQESIKPESVGMYEAGGMLSAAVDNVVAILDPEPAEARTREG